MMRKFCLIGLLTTLFLCHTKAQEISALLSDIKNMTFKERDVTLNKYLASKKQFPIVENDTTAWFIYIGKAENVFLAGDMTAWRPSLPLIGIEGTNFWYYRFSCPASTRVEYKMVINGKEWRLDSLNQQTAIGGLGKNSELRMPGYKKASETIAKSGLARGTLSDTSFFSKCLNEERNILIYLPPGYRSSGKSYPLAVFHDGGDYLKYTGIVNILDNLSAEGLSLIAVFVVPVLRDPEYSGKKQKGYTKYIVNELVPFLVNDYRILPGTGNRATVGISNGGNIALWIASRHTDVFSAVAAHSSNVEKNVYRAYARADRKTLRIYLDIGDYDIPELIPMHENLCSLLKGKAYDFIAMRYPEGHNWGFWEAHTAEALRYLFSNDDK